VCRDSEAVSRAVCEAVPGVYEVADLFHLLEKLSAPVETCHPHRSCLRVRRRRGGADL
jgi:hypothetical protein